MGRMPMLSIDEEMLSEGEKGKTLNTVTMSLRVNHPSGMSDPLTINLFIARLCNTIKD